MSDEVFEVTKGVGTGIVSTAVWTTKTGLKIAKIVVNPFATVITKILGD